MRKVYVLIAVVGLFSASVLAQEWSAAQREVWKNVEAYWQVAANSDVDGFLSYFHEDFSGWANESALPDSKDQRAKLIRYMLPGSRTLVYTIKPAAIKVHGNIAIVHYTYFQITKSGDEAEVTEQGRWTDILMKQGDRWVMIGDHGGPDD